MAPKPVVDRRLDPQPQTSKEQLLDEARSCRRQATAFSGKPEAPFLLNVADAFERLAVRNVLAGVESSQQP